MVKGGYGCRLCLRGFGLGREGIIRLGVIGLHVVAGRDLRVHELVVRYLLVVIERRLVPRLYRAAKAGLDRREIGHEARLATGVLRAGIAEGRLLAAMRDEARAELVRGLRLRLREHLAVRVGLVADDARQLGQRIVVVGRVLRLTEPALEIVEIDGGALSCHGLAHTLTSCRD